MGCSLCISFTLTEFAALKIADGNIFLNWAAIT